MTNSSSKIIAIDTFSGSPEYPNNINFNKIEQTFYKNIKKTKRDKQVIVMKMTSEKALIQLNYSNKIKFDIIFIDASHEARDVLSDNILAWKLLNENGILINDDYEWNKLNKEYFRPKLAINSFMMSFYPEINLLYKGYQVILSKKPKKLQEKPKKILNK